MITTTLAAAQAGRTLAPVATRLATILNVAMATPKRAAMARLAMAAVALTANMAARVATATRQPVAMAIGRLAA